MVRIATTKSRLPHSPLGVLVSEKSPDSAPYIDGVKKARSFFYIHSLLLLVVVLDEAEAQV